VPYVIDGHNLLFAVRGCSDQYLGLNAEFLVQFLHEYMRRSRDRAELFFDGTGPFDKSFFNRFHNLNVHFSGEYHEADDLIEYLVEDHSAPSGLVVVSSDRRVKLAAKRKRAKTIDALDFWEQVVSVIDRPEKPNPEPGAKRTGGLSKGETDEWMDIFGIK
jgi:uncharacterized protein